MNGTALVRRPSSRLADGIVTHISRSPVDVALARAQHVAYADALAASGWTIREAPGRWLQGPAPADFDESGRSRGQRA